MYPLSNSNDLYDYLFKVIIIGDSGVGKSSILTRYARNEFEPDSKTTIGVELSTNLIVVDNKRIKIAIWDTAGQERYRAATNLYYRNTLGAFIVYDITNPSSFNNVPKWIGELKEHVDTTSVVITLVGNKSDLKQQRAVSETEAKELAEKHNLRFVEVSALDSMNIELSFKDIITAILRKVESAANADNNTSASRGSSTLDIRDKNTVKLKDKNNSKRTCCRGGN